MGYIRKNAIILDWFYMQKIAFYFKPIQIIIIKKNKSSKYFKNAYFALITCILVALCNGAKWTTSLYTVFHFD